MHLMTMKFIIPATHPATLRKTHARTQQFENDGLQFLDALEPGESIFCFYSRIPSVRFDVLLVNVPPFGFGPENVGLIFPMK